MSKCALLAAVTAMSAVSLLAATAYPQEPSHPDDSAHATAHAAQTGPTPAEVSQLCRIDIRGDKKEQWMRLPKAESSVTQHHIERRRQDDRLHGHRRHADRARRGGQADARASAMSPTCATGAKDGGARPITFAFNGGPGSSSLWLHMGVLGPRRVVVSDPDPTPPAPYKLVDNEFGLLDKSDLVMIDPVGTGLSHAVCDHKDDEFWGVDPDIESVSRFIAQYLSDNNRWTSPKYLLGESYGTTRAAAILNYLREHRALAFNGLILVSVATDIEAIFAELPGNERPYAVYLPGYAAVAWYHHMLPEAPARSSRCSPRCAPTPPARTPRRCSRATR